MTHEAGSGDSGVVAAPVAASGVAETSGPLACDGPESTPASLLAEQAATPRLSAAATPPPPGRPEKTWRSAPPGIIMAP